MLEAIFYPPKVDVAFKIIIEFWSNNDFKSYINVKRIKK
jgi:hypothetical protein